ncbi:MULTISPECIES: hypothetical protein [unclassified Lysobacter]|uniref:hypothetical protein n=1 Tax=unclassified Lysobacter TaxID=2635362 RepID=UPI001BEB27E1|nr:MULTISPECIES: hypothetical protein [unclassified Lysobacter]MBT2750153.1 hypothetical protein [Lysobacter sp. ISL-50]MBT2775276.1 hypothetical protein [Lysobacter sp. ISL-54]MBT2782649.1 hypothetical protein [Lysobacter sp. ISL-52]
MRPMSLAAVLAVAVLAACSKPPVADSAKPAMADTAAPADAARVPEPTAGAGAGERPMGKIGADQVGKVSPVPAFKGFGEHWSIEIQATGEMNHKVDLTWGSGSEKASGSARYNGRPADAPGTPIVLSGELTGKDGAKPMTIEISRQDCTDDGDTKHLQSVSVHVDGMDTFKGCGDLAMY